MLSIKRERSENFTPEETDLLVKLISENKHILENKKNDAVTWNQKQQCWKDLERSFNNNSGGIYRSSKSLKAKYDGIKRESRKKTSDHVRTEMCRPGDSTCLVPVLAPSKENGTDMFFVSVDGPESNSDLDQVPLNGSERQESPKRNTFSSDSDNEEEHKLPQRKPTLCTRKQNPILKSENKRPFERVADSKLELVELQHKMLIAEMENKKKQQLFDEEQRAHTRRKWLFEEEEKAHRREIWVLEKQILLKKLHDA